jgi:hypothetical protein
MWNKSRTSRTDFFHPCGDILRYFRCASPIAYCARGINIALSLIVSLTPDLGHVLFEYEVIECPLPIWLNFQESFDGQLPLSISRTLLHSAILSSNMFRLFEGLSFLLFTHATHANPASYPCPNTLILSASNHTLVSIDQTNGLCSIPCYGPIVLESYGTTIFFYPGVPIDALVMTNLLKHSLEQIDTQIAAVGETAFDSSGIYHYDLDEGLLLDIRVYSAAGIPLLDWGLVGDVVEGLLKYNVEQQRFCLIPYFDIKIGSNPATQLGHGTLWTEDWKAS